MVKKISAFHNNRRLITVLTRVDHWFISWPNWIQFTTSYYPFVYDQFWQYSSICASASKMVSSLQVFRLKYYIWFIYTYLPIYGSTALCWALASFSVSWSFTQSVGLLGRGIIPSQGRYLHTEQHKHRINAHKHSSFKWDSNSRSKCLSGLRQSMP
jgi:hypothetical protein